MDVFTIIRESAVAGAAVTGAIVAVKGLTAWKKQLRGKSEYEILIKLLRAVYRVRDAVALVRHPFMSSGEMAYAHDLKGKENPEARLTSRSETVDLDRKMTAAAYELRWRSVTEAMSDLQLIALEAEVLWTKINELIAPIRKFVSELNVYLGEYLNRDPDKMESEEGMAFRKEIREVVFYHSDDPNRDAFTGKLNAAVKGVEDFVRPRLN